MFYLDCPCIDDKMQNHATRYLNTNYPTPTKDDGIFVNKGDAIFKWGIREPQLSTWEDFKAMVSPYPSFQFYLSSPISGTFYIGNASSKSFWGYANATHEQKAFSILTETKPHAFTAFEVYEGFFAFMQKHKKDIDAWLHKIEGWHSMKHDYWSFVSAERQRLQNTFCTIRSA